MYSEFESERLLIRPTSEEDSSLIYQVLNTPKFIKYVGDRKIRSVRDAEQYIQEKMLPQLKALGYSSYTLITKNEGVKIGVCGLYDRKGVDGIDIGFGLLPQYEGFGYAYESAGKLLHAAFQDFNLQEIKGITSKDNIASQKLLEKLGLRLVGVSQLLTEKQELLVYSIRRPPDQFLRDD